MNKIPGFLVLFFLLNGSGFAQKAPVKFGDVSMEDLQMNSYPGDTTAPAVILCDFGHFNSLRFQFTRILRIKILRKEGYVWANHSYPTNDKSTIHGITFNLENGNIVQDKLKNESIFTEKVTENYYRTRIAMPNVKEGSIIEIMFSYPGIPQVWKFQETIPEKYNELRMEQSPNFRFKGNLFGLEPLFISTPTRWVAKDMPSFKEESYMNSPENYLTKLEIDLLDVGFISVTATWDDVARQLMRANNFGIAFENSSYLNGLSKKIAETGKSELEKLLMAYESIKSEIKWDEHESLITSSPALSYIYKMKLGNSADINLMLAQLLKKLDIDVRPVVLSTRENGIISPLSPSLQKLNYVIASARVGDRTYLLDATEPYMPYYLLPMRCLNYQGRSLKKSGINMMEIENDWIELKTDKKDKKTVIYDLEIRDDQLSGNMTVLSTDYAAYNLRKEYFKFNSQEEFIDNFTKNRSGLLIKAAKIENMDSTYLPVRESFDITINNKLFSIGNEIHMLPMLFEQVPQNPFKTDARKYPIDFAYNTDKTVISIIEIPESYSLVALPSSINLVLPGNAASYLFEVINIGSTIKMTSKLTVNKSLFLQDEYPDLREFYNQMIKKQAEPVILKKS